MGVALVFAVAAAILLGLSDFSAARAALDTPSLTVTRTAVTTSVTLSPLLLLVVDSRWTMRDTSIGLISGVAMISGLALLYEGYKVARLGIVAPLASVLIAAVPVLWDVFHGRHANTAVAVGIGIGLVALVLTSYTPGGEGSAALGAVLGISSGVLFGVGFTLMGEASKESGVSPVIAQRGAGLALLFLLGAFRKEPLIAAGTSRRWAVLGGTFGLLAIASLQLAFGRGASGPVSVAASQFATVAVLLSVIFNKERMRWWQAIGVVATAVAVALIAAGG
jgi:drug/metabolite transporter (DMT)-like permease